ncbi:hypothetical protein SCHPADRAFT_565461 [Schizopora paradoxa]|uniref:Fungal pheromone STE3G-protein-coupled receptor n=1 Tax=Schizopora paradoxa TaxID=27342 RepID=A0A0H2RCA3_9AGAM|nr:hypothetical protein SCHPADRAFT_565461 [Schizopora paradoxa]
MSHLTPFPITPIGNLIGVVLALLPLASNIRKFSLGVWGYAIWNALYCLQTCVNTIIWRHNLNVIAPVWCDIVTKIQVGSGVGLRACSFVMCVRLNRVVRQRAHSDFSRWTLLFEAFFVIGYPLIIMALQVIIQPVRFAIFEELGCIFQVYSYLSYLIYIGPYIVPSLCSVFLALRITRTLMRHHKEMNEIWSNHQDDHVTQNRYHRIILIACLDPFIGLAHVLATLASNSLQKTNNDLNHPYISWKFVHDGLGENLSGLSLSSVLQFPESYWGSWVTLTFFVKWDEWIYVFHTVIFFGVFGTTPEMRRNYRSVLWLLAEHLGYKRQRVSETETTSKILFKSGPGEVVGCRAGAKKK